MNRLDHVVRISSLSAVVFWSLFIGSVFVLIQYGVSWIYFLATSPPVPAVSARTLTGSLVSVVTIASAIVCSSLIFFIVRNSRQSVRDWLGLKPVRLRQLVFWVALLFLFSFLSNMVAIYFKHDVVTNFVREIYKSSNNLYLLGFAVAIAAPIFEELFFRGFMFHGISKSRLGAIGGILITALLWTVVHQQYDWYVRGNILILGLIFGYARHRSGSLLPSLAMHSVMNAMALIGVAQS